MAIKVQNTGTRKIGVRIPGGVDVLKGGETKTYPTVLNAHELMRVAKVGEIKDPEPPKEPAQTPTKDATTPAPAGKTPAAAPAAPK